jgi:hypothetical protein
MPFRRRDRTDPASSGAGAGPGEPGFEPDPEKSLYLWVGLDGGLFVVRGWDGTSEWVTTVELARDLDRLAAMGPRAFVIYSREEPETNPPSPEIVDGIVRLIADRRLPLQLRPEVVHPEVAAYLGRSQRFIHWAAFNGKVEALADLLARGAPVDLRTESGNTPLTLAVLGGRTEAVRLLLDAGAEVEAVPEDGGTAIMLAADRGHEEIARMLVERGARPLARGAHGMTAVDLARRGGHAHLAEWLASAGSTEPPSQQG